MQEFDGASRKNPGPAGAGAVIYDDDGSQVCAHPIAHTMCAACGGAML